MSTNEPIAEALWEIAECLQRLTTEVIEINEYLCNLNRNGNPEPKPQQRQPLKPDGWICTNCDADNTHWRQACFRCQQIPCANNPKGFTTHECRKCPPND